MSERGEYSVIARLGHDSPSSAAALPGRPRRTAPAGLESAWLREFTEHCAREWRRRLLAEQGGGHDHNQPEGAA